MKKLKVLIHSNHSRAKTGFGKHLKNLITYLYKTKKYDIIELANGKQENDPSLATMPWKCLGSLPSDPRLIQECNSDPNKGRLASYGHYMIDQAIKNEKPDVYLGVEDIWGLEGLWKKKWWKKIHSIVWTPIDSVPLLDKHIEGALNSKKMIVQASFAMKALEEKGIKNTELLPVPLDPSNFFKISDTDKLNLRLLNSIGKDDFIIGFVFRNQLRKSVPNLLEGFKTFIKNNPGTNAKLLFHTHWNEGWDIPRLLKEKNIDPKLVLTTYFCDKCNKYEIKPFSGQELDCKFCGSKKSQQTSQINRGVSESQLNEIYNLMDVYCHPFTSGGQEIPIQEAKLCEIITLVTNYSCGEDYSSIESGGLPLTWSEYREPGTQFIKASTDSSSIESQLKVVFNMSKKDRSSMGKIARKFTIDFCSIDSVCSKFDDIISTVTPSDWDFNLDYEVKNDTYNPPEIKEDREWVIDLYKNILKINAEEEDVAGINHWVSRLKSDLNRQAVYNYFIDVARKDNSENNKVPFEETLDPEDKGKRILFALPGSSIDVFNSTSLLKYIKDKYPDNNIYYATDKENFEILFGNPYIHKLIQYDPIMENFSWAEGQGSHEGFFNFVLIPHTNTHKAPNFIHGDKHKIEYDINYA